MARTITSLTTAHGRNSQLFSSGAFLLISLLALSTATIAGTALQPLPDDASSSVRQPLGQEAQALEPGKAIDREIAGGQSHAYRLTLAASQYIFVLTEQRGIDLAVAAISPDGQKLIEVDGLNGDHGPEPIRLVIKMSGEYRLEVRSPDERAAAGRYEIRIEESRHATPSDDLRIAAQLAFNEGIQLITQPSIASRRKAIEKFETSLPLQRSVVDRLGEADSLRGLGFSYSSLGDKRKALDFYLLEASLRRSLGDRRGEAEVLNNIGAIYNVLGEAQKALDYYNRALPLAREAGNHRGEAATLNNLGAIYWFLGELPLAADHFNRALPLLRTENNDKGQAVTLNNLGQISSLLGESRPALDYYKRSITISRMIGDRRSEAGTLHNMGLVYAVLGETAKSLDHLNQALPILRSVGDRYSETATLATLGRIYLSKGEQQKALEHLQQALELSRATGHRQAEAFTLYQIARLESAQGNLEQARKQMAAALDLIESLRARVAGQRLRASFLATTQDYYEYHVDLLVQLHRRRPTESFDAAALETSERAIARSLLDALVEARVDIRGGVDAALLERERALEQQLSSRAELQARLLSAPHTEAQAAAINKELEAIVTQFQEVQSQIRARSPRYAALTQPVPLTLKEIQSQVLDEATLLLEYSLGQDRSYLFAVTPSTVAIHELPKRGEIEAAVRRVYESFSTGGARADQQSEEATRALSQTLLGPVAQQMRGKRLLIIATGALQYLPFAALPIPADDRIMGRKREIGRGGASSNRPLPASTSRSALFRPLIADHEIVSLPSASTLALLRREYSGRPPAARQVAVLADPVFDPQDTRLNAAGLASSDRQQAARVQAARPERAAGQPAALSFDRLRSSRREAEEILAAVGGGDNLKALDFEASRTTALSERLGQYRVVHFATHGLLDVRHPELSGLVLSLVDERGRPQNGFLRAHDVYNLKLGADLIVLSGCQTALGKEVKGEGLLSLTRGFMYAGAPRVVASLWRVPDQATAELMKRFYRGMFTEGLTPAAALRAAQVAIWKEKRWSPPYYWAAFILQGEWK